VEAGHPFHGQAECGDILFIHFVEGAVNIVTGNEQPSGIRLHAVKALRIVQQGRITTRADIGDDLQDSRLNIAAHLFTA